MEDQLHYFMEARITVGPFRYDVNMRENNSSQNLEVKTNLPRRSHHTRHESYSSDFEALQAKCRMNTLTSNLWKVKRGIERNYRQQTSKNAPTDSLKVLGLATS